MLIKAKDDLIVGLKQEVRGLEKKIKVRLNEMTHERNSTITNDMEHKRVLDDKENLIEIKEIEIVKLKRLVDDKNEEVTATRQRFETKSIARQQRSDAQIEKLNQVIQQQLEDINTLKTAYQDQESKIIEL